MVVLDKANFDTKNTPSKKLINPDSPFLSSYPILRHATPQEKGQKSRSKSGRTPP